MNNLIKALAAAQIPEPNGKNIETFKIVRWGRNNRYWLKKFEGGYVFGDFVSDLNTYVFEKDESEYTKAEFKKLKEAMRKSQQEAQMEQDRMQSEISIKARYIWSNAMHLKEHPYLTPPLMIYLIYFFNIRLKIERIFEK